VKKNEQRDLPNVKEELLSARANGQQIGAQSMLTVAF